MSTDTCVSIQFAAGGYVLHVTNEGSSKTEVFTSTPKLLKAVRGLVEELTLLPKKADKDAEGDE